MTRRWFFYAVIFCTLSATSLHVDANEAPLGMVSLPEDVRISLSLRNIDINDALKFFALKSGP